MVEQIEVAVQEDEVGEQVHRPLILHLVHSILSSYKTGQPHQQQYCHKLDEQKHLQIKLTSITSHKQMVS